MESTVQIGGRLAVLTSTLNNVLGCLVAAVASLA